MRRAQFLSRSLVCVTTPSSVPGLVKWRSISRERKRERERERERERQTGRETQRDVDAWEHPGLLHIRFDFSVFDAGAARLRTSLWPCAEGRSWPQPAPQAEQATAAKCGRDRRVTGLSLQLGGRCGPILDTLLRMLAGYRRAISKAAGKDGGRSLHKWKTFECIAGKVHRRDNPPCRRAQGLEMEVVRTSLGCCFAPFENEPFLVNAGSMTET